MTFPTLNLTVIAPLIVLVVAALLILVLDMLIANKRVLGWLSLVGMLGALAAADLVLPPTTPDFQEHGAGRRAGPFRQRRPS